MPQTKRRYIKVLIIFMHVILLWIFRLEVCSLYHPLQSWGEWFWNVLSFIHQFICRETWLVRRFHWKLACAYTYMIATYAVCEFSSQIDLQINCKLFWQSLTNIWNDIIEIHLYGQHIVYLRFHLLHILSLVDLVLMTIDL